MSELESPAERGLGGVHGPHPGRRGSGALLTAVLALAWTGGCAATEDTIAISKDSGAGVPSTCRGPATATEGVVALYSFDADDGSALVRDGAGSHDGAIQPGVVTTTAGPGDCDRALSFGAEQLVLIDDGPDWDLEVGSLDLWVWLPAELTDHVALLSRDVLYRAEPGQASLFINVDGVVIARVQPADSSDELDAVSCSDAPLPREAWVHLGLNFGPPAVELYVNGVLEDGPGPNTITDEWECQQPGAYGIAGNELPWLLGATSFRGDAPLDNLELYAAGCAIDHLRISSQRRDFAMWEW